MITVDGLTKYYGDFLAVSNVSFSANSGEVVGFLGPNGAGKTTTLRMLVTFLAPDKGTASLEGFDINKDPFEVRKRIGYLPERPPLYEEMKVREYLNFVAEIKDVPAAEKTVAVDKAIESCGLEEVEKKLCGHLSRGFRQRVGIAQAIVHQPELIVLDEPTSGLDPKQIIEIRSLIKELAKDRTVLLSTHILPEVSMVCDKVVIINRGRIVVEEQLENLLKDSSLEEAFLKAVGEESQV